MKQKSCLMNNPVMHWIDTALVTINAILIASFNMAFLVKDPDLHALIGHFIQGFLCLFIAEELVRFFLLRGDFLKDHRNIFTVIVLILAVTLQIPDLTILLMFNSFRALRLLSSKKTRHVIDTLFHAIPGVLNLLVLIIIAFVIFAVLATNLFGQQVPHLWGTIGESLISLQQIMLGDDWGNNLRETMKVYPYAWILSIAFLIAVTFILLNVFIGVIVDAMQTAEEEDDSNKDMDDLKAQLKVLRQDIEIIKSAIIKTQ